MLRRLAPKSREEAFNSLFEMHSAVVCYIAHSVAQLSILYLRCGGNSSTKRIVPHKRLSILYLRCCESLENERQAAEQPFNSLFEMLFNV